MYFEKGDNYRQDNSINIIENKKKYHKTNKNNVNIAHTVSNKTKWPLKFRWPHGTADYQHTHSITAQRNNISIHSKTTQQTNSSSMHAHIHKNRERERERE